MPVGCPTSVRDKATSGVDRRRGYDAFRTNCMLHQPRGSASLRGGMEGARRNGGAEDQDQSQAKAAMDAETAADPVGLFMKEINRVELLTVVEEQALASDIELVSHLEELELELAGELGYDYGEDDGAAGAPSTVL